jgi:Flp pilus assembly pilin Flp
MNTYLRKIVAFIRDEDGTAVFRYSLLLVMVAIVIIGLASALRH